VNENNLSYPIVDPDELLNLKSDLVALRKITHLDEKPKAPFESLIYYKVPFTKVLDLVSQRKVLLVKGYAFVENHEILSLILSEFRYYLFFLMMSLLFRSYLSHCLAVTKNHFPEFKQDTRVSALIEELPHQYLGKDYVLSDVSNHHSYFVISYFNINDLE
jgi:DNA primase large subunit